MAFIKNNEIKVGDICVTTRILDNFNGYFEIGTEVKVIDIGQRGYDLEDNYGNQMLETGFDSIMKIDSNHEPCSKCYADECCFCPTLNKLIGKTDNSSNKLIGETNNSSNKLSLMSSIIVEKYFNGFIFKPKVAELCAYNPETGIYIVIEDGMCCIDNDENSHWIAFPYKFYDKEEGMKFFLSEYKHPFSEYNEKGEKYEEYVIDFKD